MQKYGNFVRFTGYSLVLIFSFCFVNFRSLYPLLILNSTFFSEMSTKRILIPTAIKEIMISWQQKGKILKEIADLTGKPRSTVQSIIKKWKETGCVENQWCKGQPSTFSTRDANRLKRIVKTNVGASTDHIFKTFLAENPEKFSKSTIYGQLKKLKYVRRAIRKSMVIRTKNKLLRIRWARARKNWALDTWKNFCFSDECSAVLGKDSRMYCWRREDKKDAPYLVCPPKKRLVSTMVWGAITYGSQRTLKWVRGNINSQKYCSTLQELLPLLESAYPHGNYTFVQDNAPVHVSAETRTWLDCNSVNTSV